MRQNIPLLTKTGQQAALSDTSIAYHQKFKSKITAHDEGVQSFGV
jgi:hypothetical protein